MCYNMLKMSFVENIMCTRMMKFNVFVFYVRDNDITGIIDHSFCVDHEVCGRCGERIVRDFKPGGRNIPVTQENKKEYVEYVFFKLMA